MNEEEIQQQGDATETASTPEPTIAELVKQGIAEALRDAQPQTQARTEVAPSYDVEARVNQAASLREELIEDIEEIVERDGLDPQILRDVRKNIRGIGSVEELANIKASRAHEQLLNMAIGQRARSGGNFQRKTDAPHVAPTSHAAPVASNPAVKSEIAELESVLGVKFTEQEISEHFGKR